MGYFMILVTQIGFDLGFADRYSRLCNKLTFNHKFSFFRFKPLNFEKQMVSIHPLTQVLPAPPGAFM